MSVAQLIPLNTCLSKGGKTDVNDFVFSGTRFFILGKIPTYTHFTPKTLKEFLKNYALSWFWIVVMWPFFIFGPPYNHCYLWARNSLRKRPFLLALRRWGRFARRKSEEKRMFSQAKPVTFTLFVCNFFWVSKKCLPLIVFFLKHDYLCKIWSLLIFQGHPAMVLNILKTIFRLSRVQC